MKALPTMMATTTMTIRRKWVPSGGTAILPNMAMLKIGDMTFKRMILGPATFKRMILGPVTLSKVTSK
jgi:hypothetical protein